MIKTVILDGEEQRVTGLGGSNTVITNFGSATLYASAKPDIVPDGKNVAAIPAGSAVNLPDTNGTVYLLGTGRIQLEGTTYLTVNVGMLSSGSGGGGDTPTAETMPVMYGITGYFTPDTLNISGGRWKNALNGDDIILSGGSAENGFLRLTKDDFGTLSTGEPMTIYALFRTNRTNSATGEEYHSILSKHMTSSTQYHDFAIIISPSINITLSCRQSLASSEISALAVHCVCITRNENTAKLYIDGEYQGATQTRIGDYSGEYMLNKSIRGNIFGDLPGDHLYKMLAFGYKEHTPEQIAQNSDWLKIKYNLGGDS